MFRIDGERRVSHQTPAYEALALLPEGVMGFAPWQTRMRIRETEQLRIEATVPLEMSTSFEGSVLRVLRLPACSVSAFLPAACKPTPAHSQHSRKAMCLRRIFSCVAIPPTTDSQVPLDSIRGRFRVRGLGQGFNLGMTFTSSKRNPFRSFGSTYSLGFSEGY